MSTDKAEIIPFPRSTHRSLIIPKRDSRMSPPRGQATHPIMLDQSITHPGYGLDPETLVAIYRQAEAGFPMYQVDLFDDVVENDGHLLALIEGRKRAVAGRDVTVLATGKDSASIEAAEALRENVEDSINFQEFVYHQMSAIFHGWAATELVWEFRDGLHVPHYLNVPHRRFVFDPKTDEMRLLTTDIGFQGDALQPSKWAITRVHHRKTVRAGLLRCATWFALFKRMAIRDWILTMERFGIPSVIAKYDDDVARGGREIIESALQDLGEGGHAIVPDGIQIELNWARDAGGATDLHPSVTALCEAQMSKLINGATLTLEGGGAGSFALGRVHENRAFSLTLSDIRAFQRVFRRDVAEPFVRFNGFTGASFPTVKVETTRDMDPLTRAQVASILVKEIGLPLDASQLYEEFGFRAPTTDDDAVTGPPQPEPTTDDGGTFPE